MPTTYVPHIYYRWGQAKLAATEAEATALAARGWKRGEAAAVLPAAPVPAEVAAKQDSATAATDGELAAALLAERAHQIGTYRAMPKWTDLVSPVIVAHRGGGALLAPENTLEAVRLGMGLGPDVVPDIGDFRATSDGAIVANHDADLVRTTNLTGNVADYSLAGLRRAAVVDASSWFGGGWPDMFIATLEQFLAEFGGTRPLTFEVKDATAATRAAELIERTGLGPSLRVVSPSLTWSAQAAAAGARAGMYYTSSQIAAATMSTLAASLIAAGLTDVEVQHGSDQAKVQQLIDSGLDVWVYGITRQYEYDTWTGYDLRGFVLDDPLYSSRQTARYRRTTAPWVKSGTFDHGHLSYLAVVDANRGSFVGTAGAYRWTQSIVGHVLQGWACPLVTPTNYTLTVPITFDTLPTDMTRWAGVAFGQATDKEYRNSVVDADRDCYHVILRANGDALLYKVTDGTPVQIGSTSAMPDFTAGTTVTLTIDVDPTTGISVTRSDGGAAITSTDTAYRGGYFFLGNEIAASGSGRASFGAVTVA